MSENNIQLPFFQKEYYTPADFPPPQVECGFDNTAKMVSLGIRIYYAKSMEKNELSVENESLRVFIWSRGVQFLQAC